MAFQAFARHRTSETLGGGGGGGTLDTVWLGSRPSQPLCLRPRPLQYRSLSLVVPSYFFCAEIEKLHLQELELNQGLVEEQASAKLAELNHRQRKEELEERSRQIRREREQLNATFEAAKQKTSELAQTSAARSGQTQGALGPTNMRERG